MKYHIKIKKSFIPKAYQAIMLVFCIVAMSFAPHRDKEEKSENENLLAKYKSVDAQIYDSTTCKCVPDTGSLQISFNVCPVEKIDNKDSVLDILNQSSCPNSYINSNAFLEKFSKLTSSDEKIDLALHGKSAAIKLLAFQCLVKEKHPQCVFIITQSLNDSSCNLPSRSYDFIYDYLSDSMIDDFYQHGRFCSIEDSLMLDSLIFYAPQVMSLRYKESLMYKLTLTQKRYERFRELYIKEHYLPVLIGLARYRKQQDKVLIANILQEYSRKLGKQNSFDGKTYYALQAISYVPDNIFIPYIEKFTDFEIESKENNREELHLLFQAVMAYDNDWAYNFIDNLLQRTKNADILQELCSVYSEDEIRYKRFQHLNEKAVKFLRELWKSNSTH